MPKTFNDKVDDYKDSVFAIIGFANLFRYNNKTKIMIGEVRIAQGREFLTSTSNKVSPSTKVTPDLSIQLNDDSGIIAEVKISFPMNQDHWMDDFNQLMKYDDDMTNWWTPNNKLENHSIVLLPHQSRTIKLAEFFTKNSEEGKIHFDKPFSIIEFNRSSQNKEYFFFRKHLGDIVAPPQVLEQLKDGVQVPMEKLMIHYETHKIYDSKPPMPYLLYLIWENVILRKVSDKFDLRHLGKRSIAEIKMSVDDITKEMYDNLSFKRLNYSDDEHQPKMPLRVWVKDAVNALVKFKYAQWATGSDNECKIFFKKMDNVFDNFINLCLENKIDVADIEGAEHQEVLNL